MTDDEYAMFRALNEPHVKFRRLEDWALGYLRARVAATHAKKPPAEWQRYVDACCRLACRRVSMTDRLAVVLLLDTVAAMEACGVVSDDLRETVRLNLEDLLTKSSRIAAALLVAHRSGALSPNG